MAGKPPGPCAHKSLEYRDCCKAVRCKDCQATFGEAKTITVTQPCYLPHNPVCMRPHRDFTNTPDYPWPRITWSGGSTAQAPATSGFVAIGMENGR